MRRGASGVVLVALNGKKILGNRGDTDDTDRVLNKPLAHRSVGAHGIKPELVNCKMWHTE